MRSLSLKETTVSSGGGRFDLVSPCVSSSLPHLLKKLPMLQWSKGQDQTQGKIMEEFL